NKLGGHSIGKTQIKTVLDGVQLTGDYHQGIKVELSEGWHNVEYHFYFSGDRQDNLYIQPNRAFYQNYYEAIIKDIQLEKGTIATDWTPAPEDIDNDINNLSQEVTKNTTSLNVLENEISLKADSDTVKQ